MSKTLIDKSKGVYLDIHSCGSSIRWAISVKRSTKRKKGKLVEDDLSGSAECSLTDCHRWITWSDYGIPDIQLKKVSAAIETLTEYRELLKKAVKIYRKHKPIRRKRKLKAVQVDL